MRARSQESRAKARVLIRRYSTIVLPASTFQVLARIVTREHQLSPFLPPLLRTVRHRSHDLVIKMPGASVAVLPPQAASTPSSRKASLAPERKYKCQFCNRAFSRSEHRSRHERSRRYPSQFSRCRDIAPLLRYIPEDLVVFSWFSSVSIFKRASVVPPSTLFVHVFFSRLLSFRLLASSSLPCLIMDSQIFKLS